jgi:hypothetical protein
VVPVVMTKIDKTVLFEFGKGAKETIVIILAKESS